MEANFKCVFNTFSGGGVSLLCKNAAQRGPKRTDKLMSRIFRETLELTYVLHLRKVLLGEGVKGVTMTPRLLVVLLQYLLIICQPYILVNKTNIL